MNPSSHQPNQAWVVIRDLVVVPGMAIPLLFVGTMIVGILKVLWIPWPMQLIDSLTLNFPWLIPMALGGALAVLIRPASKIALLSWLIPGLIATGVWLENRDEITWLNYIHQRCTAEECLGFVIIFIPLGFSVGYSMVSVWFLAVRFWRTRVADR